MSIFAKMMVVKGEGECKLGKNFMFIHTINMYKRKIQTNICYVTVFYFLKFQDGRVAIP